jgi:GH15 family glucan-1,4-alpha-glucosidase
VLEQPARRDGYAPIRDYAAIGDGRTVALVARDGSVDWLPLPDLDSPSVFAAILDTNRGGRFALAPEVPYAVERRYLPETNVLETTYSTSEGTVRVTDALTLPDDSLAPGRELVRSVQGLSGEVPMRWSVEPRFGYGTQPVRLGRRLGVPVAELGSDSLAVRSFEAGDPEVGALSIDGRFETREGSSSIIALCAAHSEPLVLPAQAELERRLEHTVRVWRGWVARHGYAGPYRGPVIRSALALKLLVYAPSGAVAAAATTSLPEEIGGERNWDYRYSWIRDSAFTLEAFLELGCAPEARAYFWWLMHASELTHPRLQALYRLDGGARAPERSLPLEGYRRSAPVRIGNGAVEQLQLDTYGELIQTAYIYTLAGNRLDRDIGRRIAEMADLVTELWRRPDSGIWEVRSEPQHFTQSKMMCWIALDRAVKLAERGSIPDDRAPHWRAEANELRAFVDTRCWSEDKQSYVRFAGGEELDASLLLGVLFGWGDPRGRRLSGTVEAVRRELGHGPYVHRYSGEDGLSGSEGAFLSCSFWLAEALAHAGRLEEATSLLDELVALANDVGLYAEEVEPASGDFLGNMPQGLSHLALIGAATAIAAEARR